MKEVNGGSYNQQERKPKGGNVARGKSGPTSPPKVNGGSYSAKKRLPGAKQDRGQ